MVLATTESLLEESVPQIAIDLGTKAKEDSIDICLAVPVQAISETADIHDEPGVELERIRRRGATLVSGVRSGREEAWIEVINQYGEMIRSTAKGFNLADDVLEDILQETLFRLCWRVETIREPEKLAGWLYTTTRHACLHWIRDNRRSSPIGDTRFWEQQPVADASEQVVNRSAWRSLLNLATLTDKEKGLLRQLLFDPDEPYEAVAEKLAMPVGSVGPTRQRLVAKLRNHLGVSALADLAS